MDLALVTGFLALSLAAAQAEHRREPGLPEAFRGEWTTAPELCHANPRASALWQISEYGMVTEEGGVDILSLTWVAESPLTYDALVEISGGGGQSRAIMRLTTDPRRLAMDLADLEGDNELPSRLWRCADPIPERFLGEWARDVKDCGLPYESAWVTPRGFIHPEIAERTLRVEPVAGSKREISMEATTSVADITFDERRVLRLSRDGRTLTVISLGQIERASADPDWKPDPFARFRTVGDPEDVEVLLRCPATRQP